MHVSTSEIIERVGQATLPAQSALLKEPALQISKYCQTELARWITLSFIQFSNCFQQLHFAEEMLALFEQNEDVVLISDNKPISKLISTDKIMVLGYSNPQQ